MNCKTEYTLSDLIELLENAREQEGDVPVRLCRADGALFYLPEMSFGVGYEDSDGNLTDSDSEENIKVFYISY